MRESRGRAARWLAKELRELMPVWLFFLCAFSLLRLTRTLILVQAGLQFEPAYSLPLGAFIVAKAFLVAEHLKFSQRFREMPLIYDCLWRTSILFAMCVLFEFVERTLSFVRILGARDAVRHSYLEITNASFLVIWLWVLLLIASYVFVRALIREIGQAAFAERFFGRKKETGHPEMRRRAA